MSRKKVYIGLDAHSKNCFFVVMDVRGRVGLRHQVKTSESTLVDFLRSVHGHRSLVYEEGMLSQWLYVLLKDEVEQLVVCKAPGHDGPKNDFKDAQEIADLLRTNRIKPVFHSADKIMELRTVISSYEDLRQDIVRTKNRYSALFRQSAIIVTGDKAYRDHDRIEELPTASQRFVAQPLFERLTLMQMQKEEFHKKFEENRQRYKAIRLIMSIPGFGIVRANQVVAIIVTPYRFATKYNFSAYSKLIKHEQTSDGNSYGKKTPKGQNQLKEIIRGATQTVLMCKESNAFRRGYDKRLAEGLSTKAAEKWARRAVAATVLGVWKSGRKYNDKHREATLRDTKSKQSVN